MKLPRILALFLALGTAVALAADPTGTWKWTTTPPTGGAGFETTLKLETKDGKLSGAYTNQYGATTISNPSLKDDLIAFDIVRDLGGTKYVVKYRGKLEGETIHGTIEAPARDGGDSLTLDWTAKRAPSEKTEMAKPKS